MLMKQNPDRKKIDIAWFALWSLAQKEVLNLLRTCVVVLTIATHNSFNSIYLLHISLCLSTAQAIVLDFGMNNPNHKKVPFGYPNLFPDVTTFLRDGFQKK